MCFEFTETRQVHFDQSDSIIEPRTNFEAIQSSTVFWHIGSRERRAVELSAEREESIEPLFAEI